MNSDLRFARNGADLALDLFQLLATGNFNQNVIFSPISVQTCVGLAYAGARGETANEIAKGMKFISDHQPEVAACFQSLLDKYKNNDLLKMVNKVYVQEGKQIKPEYETTLKENFFAELETLNFYERIDAANAINTWVQEKTNGKIKELIPSASLGPNTRLVLLNAIHFKGEWKRKFNEQSTREGDFWINENESFRTQFMHQKGKFYFSYFDDLNCTALEMPYENSDLSMLALLPNEREGLKSLIANLKNVNLLDLSERLHNQEVVVTFPKFKIDFSIELKETLEKLDIKTMFSGSAEFDILTTPEDLSVSKVFHKACIEVNEEGTEAAAATGMIVMARMMPITHNFKADHPFLYLIWNKKNILFVGSFVNAPK